MDSSTITFYPVELASEIVPKGWGYERILVNKPEYCGKILHFEAGKKCSFHHHKQKDETFYLLSGLMEITLSAGKLMFLLFPGHRVHIPPGLLHQMRAIETSDLLEISTRDFPEDSFRIEKGD